MKEWDRFGAILSLTRACTHASWITRGNDGEDRIAILSLSALFDNQWQGYSQHSLNASAQNSESLN